MATFPQIQAPWGEYAPYLGPMTVEQFAQMQGVDGWSYELHAGRLVIMPGPGIEHAKVQSKLAYLLNHFLIAHELGMVTETTCYNLLLADNAEELLCPDLSYTAPAREAQMPRRGSYLAGAPDLVIEIASPSDTHPMLAAKMAVYLRTGVALGWVIWPTSQSVDVWQPASPQAPLLVLHADDLLDVQHIIPGFQCRVQALFPNVP